MQKIVLLAVFVCILLQCYARAMKTYCGTDKTSQTQYGIGLAEGLYFKSKQVTPVVTCTLMPISIYCCMSNFSRIQWFREENNVWLNLEESYDYNRYFYESNQTVRFGIPSHDDAGRYKCVGYGHDPSDVISCVNKLVVGDCLNTDKPQVLFPIQNVTEKVMRLNSSLELPCVGKVGPRQTSCDGETCAIGWKRTINHRTSPVSENTSERVHVVNDWIMDDNGLQSTLYVDSIDPSDFTGEYECWMQNRNGTLDPARILIIHRHHIQDVTSNGVPTAVIATCVCVLLLPVVFSIVVWRRRFHIKLYLRELRRKPLCEDEYDLVLMHCDDSEKFAAYLYDGLTASNPYKKLRVFQYPDEVMPGSVNADCLTSAVLQSRCVLAVMSPGFLGDNDCRFCLSNAVRDAAVDIIYVLYGGITSLDDDQLQLDKYFSEEVCIALRTSRRRFVSPLNDTDFIKCDAFDQVGVDRKAAVDRFWVGVRLAIPIMGRKACATEHERLRPTGDISRPCYMAV